MIRTQAAVGVLAAGLLGCSSKDTPGGPASGGAGGSAAATGGAAGSSSGGSMLGSGGSVLGSGGSSGSSGAGGKEGGTLAPDDAGDEPPDGPVEDAGPPPSSEFVGIYDTVIATNCGGATCHLAGNNPDGYFGFKPALQMPNATAAHAALVNRPLECRSLADSHIRVVPSDPVASAIMKVAEDGLCGRRHNLVVPSSFTATELGRIEAWIAGGAL